MNIHLARLLLTITSASLLAACSVAKLEARLEANPQCKDVVNPKTGALMPCPGSDKAFYRELGLAPAKPTTATNSPALSTPVAPVSASPANGLSSAVTTPGTSSAKNASVPVDCKPQIHKKTGGTLPCPAPD